MGGVFTHRLGMNGAGGSAPASPFRSTTVALNTSPGTQDITIPDFGTPTGAIFHLAKVTALDTTTPQIGLSYGATDGTNSWVVSNAVDGSVTDITECKQKTGAIAWLINPDTEATTFNAAFDSWITNGVRINITTAPPSGWILMVTLIKPGYDVAVGITALDTTPATITVGFEANLILTASSRVRPFNNTDVFNAMYLDFGMATWDGTSVRHGGFAHGYATPSGSGQNHGMARSDGIPVYNGVPAYTGNITFSSFTGTGFNITGPSSAGLSRHGYIAIGGLTNVWCGMMDTPTTAGSYALTDGAVGFTPSAAVIFSSEHFNLDSDQTTGAAGAHGIHFVGEDAYGVYWAQDDDDSNPSAWSGISTHPVFIRNNANTATLADVSSLTFTANGANAQFDAVDTTARKWMVAYYR